MTTIEKNGLSTKRGNYLPQGKEGTIRTYLDYGAAWVHFDKDLDNIYVYIEDQKRSKSGRRVVVSKGGHVGIHPIMVKTIPVPNQKKLKNSRLYR